MDVFLILTCDLEVSPGAGDAAAPVGGPAPVLPAVRLLLALLGAQEKQTVVRQQDSETWGQFRPIFFLNYQILSVNLPCKHVDFEKQSVVKSQVFWEKLVTFSEVSSPCLVPDCIRLSRR